VLGVVFIAKVKRELSMPVFGETFLGLMGLNSATYIAPKNPRAEENPGGRERISERREKMIR